jgi:uncharacterized integral membrane protein
MEKQGRLLTNSTAVLAILSIGFLAFNMLGIPIYKEQVCFERSCLALTATDGLRVGCERGACG